MSSKDKVILRGVILEERPHAYKVDGKWAGIAYDILKRLEEVKLKWRETQQ